MINLWVFLTRAKVMRANISVIELIILFVFFFSNLAVK